MTSSSRPIRPSNAGQRSATLPIVSPRLIYRALEPRMVFDAAIMATTHEIAQDPHAGAVASATPAITESHGGVPDQAAAPAPAAAA